MRRVWVVGKTGSGKSTAARALAQRLGTSWVELDAIFHQAGWQPLDTASYRARVADVVARDSWAVDGNYSAVADLVRARADTVIWLDLPRRAVMVQVVGRTLHRVVRHEELWNGNRERVVSLFRRDPEKSIIRWAWTQHYSLRARYAALAAELADGSASRADGGVQLVRLQSRAQVQVYIARITPATTAPGHP